MSLDEIETMVGGFGRYGMEAPDELEALVSALSGYEGAVKDISDLRFEQGMADLRFEDATTDIEMDIAMRRQAALEDIRNRLLGE